MRKIGKVCWWILKLYIKLLGLMMCFIGIGNYFYNASKTNINQIQEFKEAWDLAANELEDMFDNAICGFEWIYYCGKYKLKRRFIKN